MYDGLGYCPRRTEKAFLRGKGGTEKNGKQKAGGSLQSSRLDGAFWFWVFVVVFVFVFHFLP